MIRGRPLASQIKRSTCHQRMKRFICVQNCLITRLRKAVQLKEQYNFVHWYWQLLFVNLVVILCLTNFGYYGTRTLFKSWYNQWKDHCNQCSFTNTRDGSVITRGHVNVVAMCVYQRLMLIVWASSSTMNVSAVLLSGSGDRSIRRLSYPRKEDGCNVHGKSPQSSISQIHYCILRPVPRGLA